ncbi:MAG: hypothetical protein ACK5QC_15650 [Bacteroidota bacterium]
MYMKIIKTILNISILIASISCDPGDQRLKIINKSKSDIYLYYTCTKDLNELKIFRNGYYKNSKGDSEFVKSSDFVSKGSIHKIKKLGYKAWEKYVKSCKNNELQFYIFTDSLVSKYTDDEIKKKLLYSKHYVLNLNELEKLNWTIVYSN